MEKHTPFSAFIDAVCAQVRFTPAHAKIAEELIAHLEDRAEMLAAHGVPLAEAEERAAAAMGDPVEIGRGLDREHPPFWGWMVLWTDVMRIITIALFIIIATSFLLSSQSLLSYFKEKERVSCYSGGGVWEEFQGEDGLQTVSLYEWYSTGDSWILIREAGLQTTNGDVSFWLDYETWFKNPLMPVEHDAWCWRVRSQDATLAEREWRWEDMLRYQAAGAAPRVLYFDFISARGETSFTVVVPMEQGGGRP